MGLDTPNILFRITGFCSVWPEAVSLKVVYVTNTYVFRALITLGICRQMLLILISKVL